MKNHAYGVTGVRRVNIGSGINAVLKREKLALVRTTLIRDDLVGAQTVSALLKSSCYLLNQISKATFCIKGNSGAGVC